MKIPLYQVDAFTREPFKGNPAAVVPLDTWLAGATLLAAARHVRCHEPHPGRLMRLAGRRR